MDRVAIRGRRLEYVILAGIVLLGLALRLFDLTGESLWFDEAYAVWSSNMDIASLRVLWEWRIEFALFYVLLHFWICAFGQGEHAVRLFMALIGTVSIAPMYVLTKNLFSRRVAILAAFLLAINPDHVWYSQEVRSYALVVLFTILSLTAYWRLLRGGGWHWWIAHALLTGLGFHLHYYMGWIVLAQNLYLARHLWSRRHAGMAGGARRLLLWWIVDEFVVLVIAAPAIVVFLTYLLERNQWGWLAASYVPPKPSDVVFLFTTYILGPTFRRPVALRWVMLLLFGVLGAVGWWRAFQVARRDRGSHQPGIGLGPTESTVFCTVAMCVPLLTLFVMGQFLTVWVTRYMLVFLPVFIVMVSAGLATLRPPVLLLTVLAGLGIGQVYALSLNYRVPQKEDWRGIAEYVRGQTAPDDLIVLLDEDCRVPFDYYYGKDARQVGVSRNADPGELERVAGEISARRGSGQVWLVISHADGAPLRKTLGQMGCLTQADERAYIGIQLVRYVWATGVPACL